MTVSKITVEVCVASVEKALIAQQAGADRLELNTALELDGLSPTPGLLMAVIANVDLPIITMARPRPGDFCYTDLEWKVLKDDASWMLDMGASGIACGCLHPDGQIDERHLDEIRQLAHGKQLVFHLAFEQTPDWRDAMNTLSRHGVDRVMTSGRASTAIEGSETIEEMIQFANGRIEVLPAGRVEAANVREIVIQTGCDQVHGRFSSHLTALNDEVAELGKLPGVFSEIEEVVENLKFSA